jgi:signal transduction histidine kinase
MIGAGILQVRFGLRPLDRLAQSIGEVRSGRTERMQGSFPAEIRPLVSDLNGLLDSSSASVVRSRVIAGNLAHGLRTPLAILIDEADCLRRAGNVEAADTILHEARQMQRQIDFHLARARSAAALPLPGQSAPLLATLETLAPAFTRLHQERGIAFRLESKADIAPACDVMTTSNLSSSSSES